MKNSGHWRTCCYSVGGAENGRWGLLIFTVVGYVQLELTEVIAWNLNCSIISRTIKIHLCHIGKSRQLCMFNFTSVTEVVFWCFLLMFYMLLVVTQAYEWKHEKHLSGLNRVYACVSGTTCNSLFHRSHTYSLHNVYEVRWKVTIVNNCFIEHVCISRRGCRHIRNSQLNWNERIN